MIVTIDGVAGAGKTSLAAAMSEKYKEYKDHFSVQVIHMDDLYDGWENPLSPTLSKKLTEIAQAHMTAIPYEATVHNWLDTVAASPLIVEPVDMLIIEGVGSGQRSIRKFASTKIWIEFDPIVGLKRVLARDGAGIEKEMADFLEDQRVHFIEEGTREAADFLLFGKG
jgi:uridine kinase